MNRYAVFAGYVYYPSGGWADFKKAFGTVEEAKNFVAEMRNFDWADIVDLNTLEIVESY